MTGGRIEVRRGAQVFTGWRSVSVDTSLEQAASAATMEVAGLVGAGADMILDGDPVEVWCGDELVFTGWCDEVMPREAADGSTVALSARSKTADIVDCSAPAKVWRSVRLDDWIAELISEYSTGVNDEAGVLGTVVPRIKTQVGETLFDAIDRVTRELRILVTDDENGLLLFTRAGLTPASTDRIVMGENVLAMEGRQSGRDRFSTIEVKGQTVDGDIEFLAAGTYEDRRVLRFRRLIIVPEKGVRTSEAAARAQWEALTRAGRSVQYTYTVQGWTQASGRLWRKNSTVLIDDPRRRFAATPMLITACRYSLDQSGTTTTITVSPASAYTPEPLPEPRRRAGSAGRTSGRWSRWDAGGVE